MQLWKLPRMAAGALRGEGEAGERISPFQALSASLAGSLGTGNIIGVAAALTAGGPGAVVWMWISAFFGMMTVYAEGVLAAKFSTKEAPGAVGYVRRALGGHAAKLYAAGCVLSALGMGTMAQTGAVSAALGTVGVPPWAAGLIVAVLLVLCVRGGLQKAVRVTEKARAVHGRALSPRLRGRARAARRADSRRTGDHAARGVYPARRGRRCRRYADRAARRRVPRRVYK